MRVTKAATKIAVSPAQAAVQMSLRTSDFVSMADLSPREAATVLDLASLLKAKPKEFRDALTGKQLVLGDSAPRTILANQGDVLLMRPLVAHASSNAHADTRRTPALVRR